jgi:hypothetical protein
VGALLPSALVTKPCNILVAAVLLTCGCVPNEPREDPDTKKTSNSAVPTPRAKRPAPRASAARKARPDPQLTTEFSDQFERRLLGLSWRPTAARWRIRDGQLCVQNARNHPVWLKKRLPVNARVEFDATSHAPEGDIKAEFWGDGRSAAQHVSYEKATSYLAIFGGWKNSFHVLARINEHAPDRPEIRLVPGSDDPRKLPVTPERSYHFKVERNDGRTVRWFVDDVEILAYEDDAPLHGPGHEYFGFNNWEVRVCFDNLKITPLP